jgi:hypothetical protein
MHKRMLSSVLPAKAIQKIKLQDRVRNGLGLPLRPVHATSAGFYQQLLSVLLLLILIPIILTMPQYFATPLPCTSLRFLKFFNSSSPL